MTRQEFVAAAKKGWETLDYLQGRYYDVSGKAKKKVRCACAMGAAAYALKMDLAALQYALWGEGEEPHVIDFVDIICISDNAGSKEAAIKALEEWAA